MKKAEGKNILDFDLKNLFVGNISLWQDYLVPYFHEQDINIVEVDNVEDMMNNFSSSSLFGEEHIYFKTIEITKDTAKLILKLKASDDKKLFAVCEKINAMTLKGLENKGIKVYKEDLNFVNAGLNNFFSKYQFKFDKKIAKDIYNGYDKNYEWTKNELLKIFLGSESSISESRKIWDISKYFFEGQTVSDISIFNVKPEEVFVLIEVLKKDLLLGYFNLKYRNLLKSDPSKAWQLKHIQYTKVTPKRIGEVLLRVIKTEGQLKSGLLSNDDSLNLVLKTLFSDLKSY
ncbi:hypothetical protein V4762_07795 [Thermodesulfobium sp. 4217-1]|uniref:hypothetical protein n=1 Tax=Thermodesulfobium sp. 4217-1 TaxID=3120013 RepID=UPI0032214C37